MLHTQKVTAANTPFQNEWLKRHRISSITKTYDKEAERCLAQWGSVIPESHQDDTRKTIAVILENQRIWNTNVPNKSMEEKWLRENSIEITKQIWNSTHLFDWISVQPLLGPTSPICSRQGHEYEEVLISAKSRYMKACAPYYVGGRYRSMEEWSIEQIGDLVPEMRYEIQREVLTDIRNNAGTVSVGKDFEKVVANLVSSMAEKIGEHRRPNWIVVPPELVAGCCDSREDNIQKLSFDIAGMQVYVDKLFPQTQFVVGYKGDRFESGYFYCPYIGINPSFVALDPETFTPRVGIIQRYGKKLIKLGSHFYGQGQIGNLEEAVYHNESK